jgi:heterodisulfide reductase subunit A
VEGSLVFEDGPGEYTVQAGAVLIASGAVERQALPPLFTGLSDVHTAYSFERLLSMNGPTGGELVLEGGAAPGSLAIVQCAGSLDPGEIPYCSGTCCRAALKYAHLAQGKVEGLVVTRLVREQSVPGVDARRQLENDHAAVVRYGGLAGLTLAGEGAKRRIVTADGSEVPAELILLCRPVVPGEGTAALADLLELDRDQAGFLAPLHSLSGSCEAALKGIYLAGSCRGPADIREAFATGTAAAGLALSELVPGRDLVIDPQVAVVDAERCAGCRTCLQLCPYKAISWREADKVAEVSDLLCRGCGTCVAACPAGAIEGRGFNRDMLRAELEGVLS